MRSSHLLHLDTAAGTSRGALTLSAAAHVRLTRGVDGSRGGSPELFSTEEAREELLEDLGHSLVSAEVSCYAWSLLPRAVELLVDGGAPESVAALLSGLERRRRARLGVRRAPGAPDLLLDVTPARGRRAVLGALTDVHLRPLQQGSLASVAQLEEYPWTGHAVLMGRWDAAWQDTARVLEALGGVERARERLTQLVALAALVRLDGFRALRSDLDRASSRG